MQISSLVNGTPFRTDQISPPFTSGWERGGSGRGRGPAVGKGLDQQNKNSLIQLYDIYLEDNSMLSLLLFSAMVQAKDVDRIHGFRMGLCGGVSTECIVALPSSVGNLSPKS